MTLLNIRFQQDTQTGVVDVHAFVTDQEDGQFLVYTRKGNEHTSRVVATPSMAFECVRTILGHLETEVVKCSSEPTQRVA